MEMCLQVLEVARQVFLCQPVIGNKHYNFSSKTCENMKKAEFDQCLECAAPKRWLKYITEWEGVNKSKFVWRHLKIILKHYLRQSWAKWIFLTFGFGWPLRHDEKCSRRWQRWPLMMVLFYWSSSTGCNVNLIKNRELDILKNVFLYFCSLRTFYFVIFQLLDIDCGCLLFL